MSACFFFFKQKTAYEMRISDWSSDVCSSDLMTQIARISDTGNERRLQAERLIGAKALQEAQALRFNVFSGEFNAKLKGAEMGLDMDDYDVHCAHIGVRDLKNGRLVAKTRMRDHHADRSQGRFYRDAEFSQIGRASCRVRRCKNE